MDISGIGNTFIRTLTHAHYSKDVFLTRLIALKLTENLFYFLLNLTDGIRG